MGLHRGVAMFGFGGKKTTQQDDQKQKEIERLKLSVLTVLKAMEDTTPEDAARLHDQIKSFCHSDKTLPFDYKSNALLRARALECEANMRIADKLLRQAASLTGREQMKLRGSKIAESRRYFSKVCSLGADSEWKKAFQRLSETVMMSGGVQREGFTRAKPPSIAPKTPNRAKG